ncbi:hypothetical protein HCN44_001555 [Aphidius gifuensis]|uniref:Uncharacterized protein n=1 Tax=Aphidius gifuensis TaxID=684658 RepID=A0A834XUD4_APHGI|nr:hypothetical protein HCN44_001555 [Aphidius gifuensis]
MHVSPLVNDIISPGEKLSSITDLPFHKILQKQINSEIKNTLKKRKTKTKKKQQYRTKKFGNGLISTRTKKLLNPIIPGLDDYIEKLLMKQKLTINKSLLRKKNKKNKYKRPIFNTNYLDFLPYIPPEILEADKNKKPFSYSYSDGQGSNWNVNVNRRNIAKKKKKQYTNNILNNEFKKLIFLLNDMYH